jgi:hypothetical protein
VVLASRGLRETETGTEPVTDDPLAQALRRRARSVWLKTIAATIASTALVCLLA